ncbi:hypothetical protein [Mesorhizobium sp. M6A.T.Ce.TU.016.01.1.1]|uniref:hypothetical protein n=1 Tax=Mesorhizobium sp. M6A.T.Ce.TU.016.01.1.1 TaxID=2496783 RepID=UPI000FC9B69C|nr:hypothetical protein [Mesorhizobium sp. M6A.T.Ce.TU.016.01.1.1]RUU29704.1 hypothetical protein EOC94_12600 [Mesorhizobium sp. M6A.T.Ce.TU.016.01.1.1]
MTTLNAIDQRCDYCKSNMFQTPNLCEDCREKGLNEVGPTTTTAVLCAHEPIAHIVEKLDGSKRTVMLVEKYDPRKLSFWESEEARDEHRIIPLYRKFHHE